MVAALMKMNTFKFALIRCILMTLVLWRYKSTVLNCVGIKPLVLLLRQQIKQWQVTVDGYYSRTIFLSSVEDGNILFYFTAMKRPSKCFNMKHEHCWTIPVMLVHFKTQSDQHKTVSQFFLLIKTLSVNAYLHSLLLNTKSNGRLIFLLAVVINWHLTILAHDMRQQVLEQQNPKVKCLST